MPENLIAKTSTTIRLPVSSVWTALTEPSVIKMYMFGAKVESDWKQGSPITWSGVWEGKAYTDKGVILKFEPFHLLQYTHYSPLSGAPDVPENYHTVTFDLAGTARGTLLTLSQDNNATEEERQHSQQMWENMLAGMKKLLEGS